MRGTGYAIGEILIFLAIAAIIGFLIGWLVFYRRPDRTSSSLSSVNPNHVKRLEERSKALDAKLARIEKRTTALLDTLAKAPAPGLVAAAAAPEKAADTKEPTKDKTKAAPEKAADTKEPTKDKTKAAPEKAADTKEPTKDKTKAAPEKAADTKEPTKDKTKAAPEKPADTKDGADDYMTEADERINKLEETLDKLSEKLAEFGDD